MRCRPNPLASALHRSPLETGKDVVSYEDKPNNYWLNFVGAINVVNSLSVMKKFVFEDKKYTMDDMLAAMKTNWADLEPMRQEVINKAPKYGNDEAYADDIAENLFDLFADIAEHTYDINGGYWSVLAQSVSIYQATSKMSGALPDGKKVGSPLADGGISPDHGTDKQGMFTVIDSASKINHARTKGLLLNQWISPDMLEGQVGIDRMKAVLKMWNEKGLSQLQINVVDPKILLDAQNHPENYPNLTIRVSGYTANWVKLSKELQDMILARTLQSFA
jgi:pyruvate-formate lyase